MSCTFIVPLNVAIISIVQVVKSSLGMGVMMEKTLELPYILREMGDSLGEAFIFVRIVLGKEGRITFDMDISIPL